MRCCGCFSHDITAALVGVLSDALITTPVTTCPSTRLLTLDEVIYSRPLSIHPFGTLGNISIPSTKPVLRDVEVGAGGRIWVDRYVAGEATEPREGGPPVRRYTKRRTLDVFPHGTFAGTVIVPPEMRIMERPGTHLWAVQRDELSGKLRAAPANDTAVNPGHYLRQTAPHHPGCRSPDANRHLRDGSDYRFPDTAVSSGE